MKALQLRNVWQCASLVAFLVSILGVWGCSGSSLPGGGGPGPGPSASPGSGNYIKHVVLMIQENRSFDNFFSTFPGADGTTTGLMKTPSGEIRLHLTEASLDSDDLGHE